MVKTSRDSFLKVKEVQDDLDAISLLGEKGLTPNQIADSIEKISGLEASAIKIDESVNLAHPSLNGFIRKLNLKTSSLSILINSDSTGNGTNEWVYYFAQWLASNYPDYTVRWRLWNDVTNTYDSPVSLNAGTSAYFIDVWNFAVSGSKVFYPLGLNKKTNGILNVNNTTIYTDVSDSVDLCIVNHGHNVVTSLSDWNTSLRYATFTEEVLNIHPFASWLFIRQNPRRDDYNNRAATESAVKWANEKNIAIANAWDKFEELNKDTSLYADNIHPSTGLGTNEAPTGTRLFLEAITEQISRKENYIYSQFESVLNKGIYPILSNSNLAEVDGSNIPINFSSSHCVATVDTSNVIDINKGNSIKLVTDGTGQSYIYAEITGARLEGLKGKNITAAVRLKTNSNDTTSYGYCRIGLISNTSFAVDSGLNELHGQWHWRFNSLKIKSTDTYARIYIYVNTDATHTAGQSIYVDRVVLSEGKIPYCFG
jgi:hypothetical protein